MSFDFGNKNKHDEETTEIDNPRNRATDDETLQESCPSKRTSSHFDGQSKGTSRQYVKAMAFLFEQRSKQNQYPSGTSAGGLSRSQSSLNNHSPRRTDWFNGPKAGIISTNSEPAEPSAVSSVQMGRKSTKLNRSQSILSNSPVYSKLKLEFLSKEALEQLPKEVQRKSKEALENYKVTMDYLVSSMQDLKNDQIKTTHAASEKIILLKFDEDFQDVFQSRNQSAVTIVQIARLNLKSDMNAKFILYLQNNQENLSEEQDKSIIEQAENLCQNEMLNFHDLKQPEEQEITQPVTVPQEVPQEQLLIPLDDSSTSNSESTSPVEHVPKQEAPVIVPPIPSASTETIVQAVQEYLQNAAFHGNNLQAVILAFNETFGIIQHDPQITAATAEAKESMIKEINSHLLDDLRKHETKLAHQLKSEHNSIKADVYNRFAANIRGEGLEWRDFWKEELEWRLESKLEEALEDCLQETVSSNVVEMDPSKNQDFEGSKILHEGPSPAKPVESIPYAEPRLVYNPVNNDAFQKTNLVEDTSQSPQKFVYKTPSALVMKQPYSDENVAKPVFVISGFVPNTSLDGNVKRMWKGKIRWA
ncbi:unnamed protein product [Allacma fusca]|uniref:Uncharacterized protein n=1 Tax=Allacma fusca TaxID=39272 RepID=A0A8J2JN87_9HEXA|nr:unnamed protein product [Allacma fusca]